MIVRLVALLLGLGVLAASHEAAAIVGTTPAAEALTISNTGSPNFTAGATGCTNTSLSFNNNSFVTCTSGAWATNPLMTSSAASAPYTCSSTYQGMMYFDTGANALKYCNGTSWILDGTGSTTAAGSTGQVQFNNAGAFAASANFFWDNSNYRLGLGTSSPTNILSLSGAASQTFWMERNPTSATAGNGLTVEAGGAYSGGTNLNGGNLTLTSGISTGTGSSSIQFQTFHAGSTGTSDNTATTAMTITGVGNVGIGTTSPSNILSLGGGAAETFWMERNPTASTAGNGLTVQAGGAASGGTDLAGGNLTLTSGVSTGTGSSAIQFQTFPAGSSGSTDNTATTAMTILGNGNVGIGTTSPTAPLNVYFTGAYGLTLTGLAGSSNWLTFRASATPTTDRWIAYLASNSTDLKFYDTADRVTFQAGGNVGIGATAPMDLLDVKQNTSGGIGGRILANNQAAPATGNEADIAFKVNSNFSSTYYSARIASINTGATSFSDLAFYIYDGSSAGGTEKLRILNNGNVGIGTTGPATPLHILGSGSAAVRIQASSGNFAGLQMYDGNAGNSWSIGHYWASSAAPFIFSYGPVGTESELMRITSTGSVGIGSNSPGEALDVYASNATERIHNTSDPGGGFIGDTWYALQFGMYNPTGSAFGSVGAGVKQSFFAINASGIVGSVTNAFGNPAFRNILDNGLGVASFGGNVGINTTSPGQRLSVAGGAMSFTAGGLPNPAVGIGNTQAAAVGELTGFYTLDTTTGYQGWVGGIGVGGEAGSWGAKTLRFQVPDGSGNVLDALNILGGSGNVGIGSTSPAYPLDVVGDIRTSGCLRYASSTLGTCASDVRIKRDVKPFELGLAAVAGLKPVTFYYNGLAGNPDDGHKQIGLIAQDVEKVAPALVVSEKVKLHLKDKDATEIKAVDYGAVNYMLVNAVKELKADNDNLRADLSAEKAANDNFERRLKALESARH